jgi:atonal protein 8
MSPLLEKDAGFCSGSSEHEDDHSIDGLQSPTDASEDSVEVKYTPVNKNKRKSSEPLRIVPDCELGPLKKRFRYENIKEHVSTIKEESLLNSHFRPWAPGEDSQSQSQKSPNPADLLIRHPGVTTLHRAISKTAQQEQEQPLALVSKRPAIPTVSSKTNAQLKSKVTNNLNLPFNPLETLLKSASPPQIVISQPSPTAPSSNSSQSGKQSNQRNYKNMTRERRIEANARERTRVHTISAAYETLRKAVPAYSHTQKLSKLSVLRVACSYILTLSRMAGEDFSADQSEPTINSCVDQVTKTIQTEGKLRKRKDDL